MLGKPALRVHRRGEEVEHRATAAAGVGLSIEHPGDDDRSRGRPLGSPVGSDSCPMASPLMGSREAISIGSPNIGATPSC
jgi:hypothetical protein